MMIETILALILTMMILCAFGLGVLAWRLNKDWSEQVDKLTMLCRQMQKEKADAE
jgi:hypothetical protein